LIQVKKGNAMLKNNKRSGWCGFVQVVPGMLVLLIGFISAAMAGDPVKTQPRTTPLKIFCIGDSITQGHGLKDADGKQAMAALGYPVQLGKLMGPQVKVSHYGAGGTTYFRNGPHPFEKTAWLAYLKIANPDVVTMAFGTNCSRKNTWPRLHDQYGADIKWLISQVRNVNSNVVIYICLPPPAYSDTWEVSEPTIIKGVIPALRKVAEEEKCFIIDLHSAMLNHPEWFPDTIHPNVEGMKQIARTIAGRLYETREDIAPPITK